MCERIKQFIRYWGPPIALCVAIFIESSSKIPDVGPDLPYFDKAVHFLLFGFLGILFHRAFGTLDSLNGRDRLRLAAAIIAATVYGLSDEFHQSFVPYRSADVWDAVADALGAILMVTGFHAYRLPLKFSWGETGDRSQ